jgi:hypothetical protein
VRGPPSPQAARQSPARGPPSPPAARQSPARGPSKPTAAEPVLSARQRYDYFHAYAAHLGEFDGCRIPASQLSSGRGRYYIFLARRSSGPPLRWTREVSGLCEILISGGTLGRPSPGGSGPSGDFVPGPLPTLSAILLIRASWSADAIAWPLMSVQPCFPPGVPGKLGKFRQNDGRMRSQCRR